MTDDHLAPRSPFLPGLTGRCPRCGDGRLFSDFLTIAPSCARCGLDFGFADAGDGPAVFVCLIGGFIVLGAALWTEATYQPRTWVELLIFLPLTLVVSLGLLRPLKGLLVALQFANKAGQGRWVK